MRKRAPFPLVFFLFLIPLLPSRGQEASPSPQSLPSAQGTGASTRPIRVHGRHFLDAQDRVILLRGVNLSGDAKVPPFLPSNSATDLDPLVPLGFNVLRLLFMWEAYEPNPGEYNEAYLNHLRMIVRAANERCMHVVLDVHQDGFSRYTAKGAGDGFPAWAVSRRGTISEPDNGPSCKNWPVRMFTDPSVRRSFEDFYRNEQGVRTRFLLMIDRIAEAFATEPAVIGYDLLNEPHGDEETELAPLYEDMAKVIRGRDPDAILFVQGHITTNSGFQTRLPGPPAPGVAYAPHYYNLTTIVFNRWHRSTRPIDKAFEAMLETCQKWNAPLFLGEFGMGAEVKGNTEYIQAVYDRMDAAFASGTQWNYTPNWHPELKDGWNAEDYNILDRKAGFPRSNFEPRPYPRATAGMPVSFSYQPATRQSPVVSLAFTWDHDPGKGQTELFMPESVFGPTPVVEAFPPDVRIERDRDRQLLLVRSDRSVRVLLRAAGFPTQEDAAASDARGRSRAQILATQGQ